MVTATVGGLFDPEGAVATLPTEVTRPGVVWLFGRVIVTWSPAFTSDCRKASRSTVTCLVVEVAVRIGPPAGPPSVAGTVVTRAADGRNTASPSASWPFAITR